jgi:hypothetical protein
MSRFRAAVSLAVVGASCVGAVALYWVAGPHLRNDFSFANYSEADLDAAWVEVGGQTVDLGYVPAGESVEIRLPIGARQHFRVCWVRAGDARVSERELGDEDRRRMFGTRWRFLVLPDGTSRYYGTG